MPTLADVQNAALPAGVSLAQWLAGRSGLSSATNTINTGVAQAGQGIQTAAQAAQADQARALATQQGVYDSTVARNDPYVQTGVQANAGYQGLINNPATFDPSSVATDPGYQFGLDEGLSTAERAGKGVVNGQQVRAKTRFALDYATTKYNDAFQRFRQTQQDRQNLLQSGVTIGQNANNADAAAGTTFGNQSQTNATQTGNIGTNAAEDQASLTLAQAELNAKNQGLQANNTSSTIGTLGNIANTALNAFKKPAVPGTPGSTPTPGPQPGDPNFVGPVQPAGPVPSDPNFVGPVNPASAVSNAASVAPTIGELAAGGGAATAGGLASIGAAAPGSILAGTGALATPEIAAPALAAGAAGDVGAATSTAASGGLGSTLASLATNPITIGIAGALAVGALWLKSQAHWEANDAVQHIENPFNETYLQPEMKAWDSAVAGGKLTQQQGQQLFDQYQQNFEGYITKINQWAGNDKQRQKVAQQSINNLYQKNILPQIQKRTAQIAAMPSGGANANPAA